MLPSGAASAPAPTRTAVVGMVEEFSRSMLTGWVSVPADAPPTKVTLRVGGVDVSSTYATANDSMSGSTSVLRGNGPASAKRPPAASVHAWQDPMIPGPKDDRRNGLLEIRTFSFRLRDIWDYCRKGTKIRVIADGSPLPIYRHGMFLLPPQHGDHTVGELREKLENGYVLGQWGRIQLSKQLDTEWQESVMALYQRVRTVLDDALGLDAFVIYGTLLGAVRDGGYIGHDVDFDAAYVSRCRTGAEAAAELTDIALVLIESGLLVEAHKTLLHINDPDHPTHRIDLFHTWFDHEGRMRYPFGVAGAGDFEESSWQGTEEIPFPGGRVLAPVAPEGLIEHLYGADWRLPKPGFNWNIDRTDSAPSGELSVEQRTKIYWADFYARNQYTTGSTFFEFVAARAETPDRIVDIGCGDGRDSCAFGASQRTVLGLDQSPVGIENARQKAADLGLGAVSFRTCDVASVEELGEALDSVRDTSAGPIMFYLRFFLHAIHAEVQEALLDAIDQHARPGDQFAAELRTDKDAKNAKVHTKHYRRFQNAEELVGDLARRGWDIQHQEEGTGLSPYGDEDPVLLRVIARR